MTFRPRPDSTTPGRSAIELWDADRHAATIYAGRAGIRIEFEPGYEAGQVETDIRQGSGVLVPVAEAQPPTTRRARARRKPAAATAAPPRPAEAAAPGLPALDRAVEALVRQYTSGAVIDAAWAAAHRIFHAA